MPKELILQEFNYLKQALDLLAASLDEYKPYVGTREYTPKDREYYDSLSFRYEKSVELILSFLRALEIYLYGQKSETLRDLLLKFKKLSIVDDIDFWLEARGLRNRIAHTYKPEELSEIYKKEYDTGKKLVEFQLVVQKYLTEKSL